MFLKFWMSESPSPINSWLWYNVTVFFDKWLITNISYTHTKKKDYVHLGKIGKEFPAYTFLCWSGRNCSTNQYLVTFFLKTRGSRLSLRPFYLFDRSSEWSPLSFEAFVRVLRNEFLNIRILLVCIRCGYIVWHLDSYNIINNCLISIFKLVM